MAGAQDQAFAGKVAVITGGGSGIGLALARQCAQEGMKIVIAGRSPERLQAAQAELETLGAEVLAVTTDVTRLSEVEALLQQTLQRFGAVHLLCNNAGVISLEDIVLPLWEVPLAEWQRTVDINLWGVIHGLQVFTPVMLQQDIACYMVNLASWAGIEVGEEFGIYRMTRHAVVTLTETLHQQLTACQAKLSVAVVCPGYVNTPIVASAASFYESAVGASQAAALRAEEPPTLRQLRQGIEGGTAPGQVAELVFEALRRKALYVFPHPEAIDAARARLENMLHHQVSGPRRTS
jgi:NAD(P)-dependent dehydrogenase (short-subunit alcohol dehydrogenase family)